MDDERYGTIHICITVGKKNSFVNFNAQMEIFIDDTNDGDKTDKVQHGLMP